MSLKYQRDAIAGLLSYVFRGARPLGLMRVHKFSPSLQPQRGCDPKPRVGPSTDLPWVRECDSVQPQRGCGPKDIHSFRHGDVATPSGLTDYLNRLPRVARSSQPWALGRSPVGARKAGWYIRVRGERRAPLNTYLLAGRLSWKTDFRKVCCYACHC